MPVESPNRRDGLSVRGRAPTTICSGSWPGLEFHLKEQDISDLTAWSIQRDDHLVIVHLDGPFLRLETELPGTSGTVEPPMPGDIWIIPAGVRYSSLGQGGSVRYAELYIDKGFLQPGDSRPQQIEVGPQTGHYDPFVHHAIQRLAAVAGETDDVSGIMSQTLGQALGTHIFLEYSREPGTTNSRGEPTRLNAAQELSAKEFIAAHLGEEITLASLSAEIRLPPHQVLVAFRGSFGTTPAQYIIDRRLRRARWLLRSTNRDILTIAMETGFSNHGHFTTLFRSRVGITPREYRARQGAGPSD